MNFGLILRFSLDNLFSPPYNYFINGTLQEKEDFMPSLILNELAQTAARLPHHPAVIDEAGTLSWQALHAKAQSISTALAKQVPPRRPICVFAEKSTEALVAFFGIVGAGCFYTYLAPELPGARLVQIANFLAPARILTTDALLPRAAELFGETRVCAISALCSACADCALLEVIQSRMIDTDPLYINFTSGSTGTPKGIVISHRSVCDFIPCFCERFGILQTDIIANQAPFDFDVSVKDIYSAVHTGATLLLIPRRLFSVPAKLLDFLCLHKATTLIWAVSALCMLSAFHGLDYRVPHSINKILFSGESMPAKHLHYWRAHLPHALFVNLYGPTEITCNCTYHILQAEEPYENGIPIGKAFPNEEVFLLDGGQHRITEPNTVGEIAVRGTALALGYWNAPQENEKRFVQNPLCTEYPERIYRTGDLGKYDENGDLRFCGRADFQIKYMGHRIELEEIERVIGSLCGVERCCCLFDSARSRLCGFYAGTMQSDEVSRKLREILPAYMIPGKLQRLAALPLNKNGKIDRNALGDLL